MFHVYYTHTTKKKQKWLVFTATLHFFDWLEIEIGWTLKVWHFHLPATKSSESFLYIHTYTVPATQTYACIETDRSQWDGWSYLLQISWCIAYTYTATYTLSNNSSIAQLLSINGYKTWIICIRWVDVVRVCVVFVTNIVYYLSQYQMHVYIAWIVTENIRYLYTQFLSQSMRYNMHLLLGR